VVSARPRLDAWDANPRDDNYEPFGRDNLRLHRPGRTRGCIAAKDWTEWGQARNLLDHTRTDSVPDMFKAHWWSSTGRPIKRYGTLFVVNCGQ
jgi:hypothetical protein